MMPPKITFTKEYIIQAAFEIVQEKGIKTLTARKVAEKLESSTAPVYSYVKSMDELKGTVIRKAKELLLQYMTKPYTDKVFVNIETGIVLFARDHTELYRAIFVEEDDFKDIVDEYLNAMRQQMVHDSRFTTMSPADKKAFLTKMWIFTYGLAAQVCDGVIKNCGKKNIIKMLSDVGSSVIVDNIKCRMCNNWCDARKI